MAKKHLAGGGAYPPTKTPGILLSTPPPPLEAQDKGPAGLDKPPLY